jgi:hypothetical protein
VVDLEAGLQVIDVRQPEKPMFVGAANVPGFASDIVVNGHYAYVSTDKNGLLVFDLSSPSHPVFIHTFSECLHPRTVAISGDYLYTHDVGASFAVKWNVKNPEKPVAEGKLSTPCAKQLILSGTFAYVLDGNAIKVMDLNALGEAPAIGEYSSLDFAGDISVQGRYAYAVGQGSGLQVLDVSDPSTPLSITRLNVMTNTTTLVADGDYLYVGADGSLWVLDISRPAQPKIISRCPLDPEAGSARSLPIEANQIIVTNHFAFVACEFDFEVVKVIDITNPAQPRLVTSFSQDSLQDDEPAGPRSKCIFLSNHIIEIGQPGPPVRLGQLGDWSLPRRSACVPGYVFVPDLLGELNIVNVTQPKLTMNSYSFKNGYRPRDVFVARGHAFVADDGGYLHLLDVRNPQQPALLETLRTSGSPLSVFAAGDYVYLANGNSGMEIYKVCTGVEAETVRRARASIAHPGVPPASTIVRKLAPEKQTINGQPTISLQEQEIVEALLAHEFRYTTNTLVLLQETGLGHPSDHKQCFSKGPENEAEQDFLRKNQASVKIVWAAAAPANIKLLPRRIMDGFFAGKHNKHSSGWDAYYQQFPHAPGIIEISRVGIDAKGTVALVYLGNQSHYLAGSGAIRILRRKAGKWVVDGTVGTRWVS